MKKTRGSPGRTGFTLMELILAMSVLGLIMVVAAPQFTDAIGSHRADRAVRAVALDLEQALGLAARQRAPVRVFQPEGSLRLVVENAADGTVYLNRNLGEDGGHNVEGLQLAPNSIQIFPTGRASSAVTVTVRARGRDRVVAMSQAGRVRVLP